MSCAGHAPCHNCRPTSDFDMFPTASFIFSDATSNMSSKLHSPASWKWHCRKPRCGSCKNGAFSKQISMKSGLMKIQNLTKSHRSDHQNHHADLLRLAWPDEFSSDAMLTPWPCAEVGHVSHVGRKLTDFGVFRGFFIKKATKKSELSGAVCTLATCAVARRCAWCCNEIRGRVGWLELTCRKGDMI